VLAITREKNVAAGVSGVAAPKPSPRSVTLLTRQQQQVSRALRFDDLDLSRSVAQGFGNAERLTRSATTTRTRATVISFLNVFHQSMQQKYDFNSETSHYVAEPSCEESVIS
jgi:hypothetical protein